MRAGTIVASNYSAMARVLGESFLDHHPDSTFHVLVIDDDVVEFGDRIQVARLADLDLGPAVTDVMKTIYDVMEFATSVKPAFLRMLLALDPPASAVAGPVACYLDPDIVVYSNFDDEVAPAVDHGIVLTPHALEPIPRDGKNVSEGTIMQSGMYNCGFVAVGTSAVPFLDWWDERLRFDAVVDFENSHFTDQRWVDWVPSLFDYHICRDTGMNIAWWNIHERPIDTSGVAPTTTVGPVRFVHFSGYDPTQPDVLSKHQGGNPRVAHAPGTGMRELADRYADRLAEHDHIERRRGAYPWNVAADGTELTTQVRRSVRAAILHELEHGASIHDRITPDGFGGGAVPLDEWLTSASPTNGVGTIEPIEPALAASVLGPLDTERPAVRRSGVVGLAARTARRARPVYGRAMTGAQRAGDRVRTARQPARPIGERRPFAFLHVPKSAGSSIVASLRGALAEHEWAEFGFDPAWMGPYRDCARPVGLVHQVLEDPADLASYDAVAGHFKLDTLLTRFDSRDVATVVREPRCRLLSHYEYWRGLSDELRTAELPWESSRSATELDFADWLADESIAYQSDNTLIRQLVSDAAIPDNEFIPNDQLARLARRAIAQLRSLGFVGLVEQGDAVFDQLGTFVGATLEQRRINVTARQPSLQVDPAGVLARAVPALAARTAGDALVWHAAAEMVGVRNVEVAADAAWMRRLEAVLRVGSGTT